MTLTRAALLHEGANMNKTLVTILSLFLLSVGLVWYSVKQQMAHRLPLPIPSLTLGTNAEYRPFSFIQDNTISGFDIDLIREIEKKLGKKIKIRDMPWTALIPEIQLGTIDMIIGGLTPTPERAKNMLFTKPYLTEKPLVIITLTDGPVIRSIDDLLDKTVIVNEGFTSDFYMSKLTGPELIRLDTIADSFLALETKRGDAIVADQNSSNAVIESRDKNMFKVTPIPDVTENFAIAVSKKNPSIFEKIQTILDALEEDGTVQRLKAKWNLA